MKKMNFLWVSFEDCYPRYGCYGDKVARTPNLDKLAQSGALYPNAFSCAGVCAPARSGVITGMYPTSIGTHHMRTTHTHVDLPELPTPYSAVIPHYVKCFSEYMRADGYYCTNNSKTDYQFTAPVTAWDECSDSAHWRNRPDPDQPFFAVFNLMQTHESTVWPDYENPVGDEFNPDDVVVPPYYPDTKKVRKALADTYSRIEYNDSLLGEFLEQLEEDGLAENTVVFHWSDHGPLPRGKRWPYDQGIKSPMIIRWPGKISPGEKNDRLVSTIDLGPTVMSIAGVETPKHIQGKPFLGEKTSAERDFVFASRDRYDESYDMVRASRDKRFKYMRNYFPGKNSLPWVAYRNHHPIVQELWRCYTEGSLEGSEKIMFENRPAEELYDTENDPWEINNLAVNPEYKNELERMSQALENWIREVGDMGEISESEMVEAWYPNGKKPVTAAPVFVPICNGNYGEVSLGGGVPNFSYQLEGCKEGVGENSFEMKKPSMLQLHSATQGASIAYTFEDGEDGEDVKWLLYTNPIELPEGESSVRAKAIRIGYKESIEVRKSMVVL